MTADTARWNASRYYAKKEGVLDQLLAIENSINTASLDGKREIEIYALLKPILAAILKQNNFEVRTGFTKNLPYTDMMNKTIISW